MQIPASQSFPQHWSDFVHFVPLFWQAASQVPLGPQIPLQHEES
jgi:hypothetical protein